MVRTVANCASDRQVSPVSAPPAQRSDARICALSWRQLSTLLTMPSLAPSSRSQAASTAFCTSSVLARFIQPAPPLAYSARPTAMFDSRVPL